MGVFMEFFVNDEKIDISLENEKTIGDILKSFEETAAKNDATTIGIKINGKRIPAEEFDEATKKPVDDNTKIELQVLAKATILSSFGNAKKRFSELAKKLPEVPVDLQSGKDMEANEIIKELAEAVDDFCHTSALSALFPEVYSALKIDNKTFTEFFEDFARVMGDFEESLKSKDTVTSGDLCEYEIAPRLEQVAAAIDSIL
jgi:hypothetical protein